jgi:O-antigen/teichoic acid export membrane protein
LENQQRIIDSKLDSKDNRSSTDIPISESLEKNVMLTAKGGSIIFSGKLFVYLIGFFTAFILARFLGAEQYGLYKLALSVIVISSSLSLVGLDLGLIRYVSIFANRKDHARLWGTLQLGIGLPFFFSLIASAAVFVLADLIAVRIFQAPELGQLLRLACLIIPFVTLNKLLNSTSKGFNRMQDMVIADRFVNSSVKVLLILLFAVIGLTAARAITAFGIAEISATILFVYFINRVFSLKRPFRSAKLLRKEIFRFSLPVYLSNTVQTFSGNIQTILLGGLSTVTNVGIFSLASQINLVGSLFHSSISGASMPVISTLYDREDYEHLKRIYQTTSKWTFSLNLPLFLIIVLYPDEILSIFGDSFVDGAAAISILAWANLVNTGTGICGSMLDMTGHTRLKLMNSIIAISVTVILNLFLIQSLGLIGVAIATLSSVAILNFLRVGEVYKLMKMLPFSIGYLKPIFSGLISLAVILLLMQVMPSTENFIYVILNSIVLIIVYIAILLLLGLSAEDRQVLHALSRRLGRLLSRNNDQNVG